MSQAPSPVPVRVQQLSGQELVAASLDPSSTVRQLQAEVERQLGASYALHEARLCLGAEQLPANASMAQLAARLPGGDAVVLDAVVTRSAEKADELSHHCFTLRGRMIVEARVADMPPILTWDDGDVSVNDELLEEWADDLKGLVEKYGAALELAHRATEDVFTAPVLAAIKDAEFLQLIGSAWNYYLGHRGEPALPPRQAEREALQWMAHEHPQAAVREAARELEQREGEEEDADADTGAAAAPPPREGAAAETEAAAVEGDAGGALPEEVAESERIALEGESQQLSLALMLSKADRWSADGVVLLRLTCVRPDITQLLLTSEPLAPCRERMRAAGCEMTPSWAGGALLLVPITEGQISEAGIQLRPHHVLVLESEKGLVEQALRQQPRKRGRPQLRPERDPDGEGALARASRDRHQEPAAAAGDVPERGPEHAPEGRPEASTGNPSASAAADLGSPVGASGSGSSGAGAGAEVAEWQAEWMAEVGLVVERTFLRHVPVDASEASAFVESAPACPGEPADRVRRWRADPRGYQ